MQGVGNFVNVAVIIILLVCFNQIKPGNGPGRAGEGYSASYISKEGTRMKYAYKYRPNALSGMIVSVMVCICCDVWNQSTQQEQGGTVHVLFMRACYVLSSGTANDECLSELLVQVSVIWQNWGSIG